MSLNKQSKVWLRTCGLRQSDGSYSSITAAARQNFFTIFAFIARASFGLTIGWLVSYATVRGQTGMPSVRCVRISSSAQTSFYVPRCIRPNSRHTSVHFAVGVKACDSALGLSGSAMIPLAVAPARSHFQ
jgi:hypothetical protein